jgi:hypothetical protein
MWLGHSMEVELQVRPPQRYGYADLVAYALTVAKNTTFQKPFAFSETVTSSESAYRVIAINEKIKSLHKNQTCDLVNCLRVLRMSS